MIDEKLLSGEEMMEKAIAVAQSDLSGIRTGRANPAMFNGISVEYYGVPTPINQIASISVPEPRLVVVKPYETAQLDNIEKAIRNSDLGMNPSNDGAVIRLAVPQLTEERRKELVKQAKAKGEEAKITVRNVRRKIMDELSKLAKNGDASEDDVARAEKEFDKVTQKYVAKIDDSVKVKESELMEV